MLTEKWKGFQSQRVHYEWQVLQTVELKLMLSGFLSSGNLCLLHSIGYFGASDDQTNYQNQEVFLGNWALEVVEASEVAEAT